MIRRAVSSAVVALALVTGLGACADDDETASRPASTPTASPTSSAGPVFPVTIAQSAGDVTIEAEPQRVVALDSQSADAAIALGVAPVGMAELSYIPGGVQEWTTDALDGATPELFNTDDGYPFEAIAALDPDVLLATNAFPLVTENWAQLNAIAPVVAHVQGPGKDGWQDGVRKVAQALGRTADGDQLIADAEQVITAAREANPAFEGRTVSFFAYVPGAALDVISSDEDASMRFLRDLGFAGSPEQLLELGRSDEGLFDGTRVALSAERYDLLDADVILGTAIGEVDAIDDLTESALFQQIPAVARGSFFSFGIGPATAMAFPSVLSVPYAVRELVDDLAAAVQADMSADSEDSPEPSATATP